MGKSPKTLILTQVSQDSNPHGLRDQNDLLYLNMCTALTCNTCNTHSARTPACAQWAIHIMIYVSILLAILYIYVIQTPST